MGEIDDLYKTEAEELDSNFLEELKNSKDKEKSFEKYRKNLRRLREKFNKNYDRFNAKETQKIRKMKKKIKGMGKFKHLEIKHFDFEFGFWERMKMEWSVRFFNLGRKFRLARVVIFPSWFLYAWFSVRNFFKATWRDFMEVVELSWEWMKKVITDSGVWVWESLKTLWGKVKVLSGKVLFWRKIKVAKEGEEGEKKEEEEKEGGEKEGES